MRRTKDELGELLQTRMPRIVERADRRTFAQCLKLRDLVANRADSETLEREFRALQPKLPFARIKPKMMSTGFSIAFDQNMEQSKREQHLKALEEEMIFLSSLSDQPSLTRYA